MIKLQIIISILTLPLFLNPASAQSSFIFKGQASSWLNYNPGNELSIWTGLRYVPQLNYRYITAKESSFTMEVAANINGSSGFNPFNNFTTEGTFKPYRAWIRYATNQMDMRLGLQKINFGSTSMLRPLMWFDQVDPRDPLQLTNGVWSFLWRYYFISNTNIWLWALYGNEGMKPWEIGATSKKNPEMGARLQHPTTKGELALTYHHRKADMNLIDYREVPENRLGIDGKWDMVIGLWVEAVWIGKSRNIGMLTHQHMLTLGADYTFGLGNGLNTIIEQTIIGYGNEFMKNDESATLTAVSTSYPLGLFDSIHTIVYQDWTNNNQYLFFHWQRKHNRFNFYIMAFLNPDVIQLPQQPESTKLFSGKGMQLMVVFHH